MYRCVQGSWLLIGPSARLFNEHGEVIGSHDAGPIWRLKDGSLVKGHAIGSTASSNPQSVPWLLLEASFGTGKFKTVTFIQRRDTLGGAAPSAPCKDNAELQVPYSADYLFFAGR